MRAGDHVLRRGDRLSGSHLRVSDIFGRVGGGEEFGVVLPGCGLEDAKQRAERLRVAVARDRSDLPGRALPGVRQLRRHSTEVSGYELRQLLASCRRGRCIGPKPPAADRVMPCRRQDAADGARPHRRRRAS